MKKLFLLSAFGPTALALAAPVAAPQPKTKPAVAKPKVTKPAVAKPAVAQTAIIKPAVAKPAVAKPAVTKPAVAKPMQKPLGGPMLPALASTLKKLPNGIVFVARPDNLAPRAAISLLIRAGAADETPETAGWRRILVNAMLRGAPQGFANTTGLSTIPAGEGLPRAAEKLGGRIGATVGDDFVEIYVVGDAPNASQLLDLALALWKKPRLSDEDFQSARERAQNQVEADDLDTAGKTQAALRSQLFRTARGDLAAYGLSDYGTVLSLANLSSARLRSLHTSKLATARVTVAATGNFDAAALQKKLAALPAQTGREAVAPIFAAPKASAPALVVRELPVPAAWVFVSYPLAGNTQSDAPALRVLAAALGDSSRARLPERLLENQPMGSNAPAISVAAQFVPRRYAGEMVLFAQTSPQNVERVKNALLDEMRRLRETPLSKIELESAKTYARGSWSVERQNLRDRAFQTALSPALGGPSDTLWPARLSAVSSGEVQRVAKKYLRAYAVALVMPNG